MILKTFQTRLMKRVDGIFRQNAHPKN